MHIVVNGESREVADQTALTDLLAELDLPTRRYAVEINTRLIPRSEHPTRLLCPDDRIEIVQAIGGG